MKKKKIEGFTLVELLIAISIGLISVGVIYGIYQLGIRTYQFQDKKMKAVDKLWLTMDRIQKDTRVGKKFIKPSESESNFTISIPPDALVFATNDTTDIAFYTSNKSIYKKISSNSAKIIASGVTISVSPLVTSSMCSTQITLAASWAHLGVTREETLSSKIYLRNWKKE